MRTLVAHINSLTCPRAKFHPNQHGGGITRVEIGKGRVANKARSEKNCHKTCVQKLCLKFFPILGQKPLKVH
jgi:hypothetical protein